MPLWERHEWDKLQAQAANKRQFKLTWESVGADPLFLALGVDIDAHGGGPLAQALAEDRALAHPWQLKLRVASGQWHGQVTGRTTVHRLVSRADV